MFKKLFSIFLAAIMMMSLATLTLAASNEPVKSENIYKLWGDFENPDYHASILGRKVIWRNSSGTKEIVEGGAYGSKYALKITQSSSDRVFLIQYAGVVGETYDLSIMLKTDTPELKKVRLATIYDRYNHDGYVVHDEMKMTKADGWVEYKITFTVPTRTTDDSQNVYEGSYMIFDIDEGSTNYVMYVDNIKMYSHNNVPEADYSIIDAGMVDPEGWDGVTVTEPAETAQVGYTDIKDHWAEDTIETLTKFHYVNGLSFEQFAPNAKLTRAQFIKMVADLYDDEAEYDERFSDVASDSWFAKPIIKADNLGIIPDAMKENGKINPDAVITREEAAAIAAKVAIERGGKPGKEKTFTDSADISDWAVDSVSNAASLGMIVGYEDGSYKPKSNLTRAEAATILMRIIEVSEKINIYVDAKTGSDKNPGTESEPLATIFAARDMAKKYAPAMRNDIYIKIRGEQYVEETFKLDESDSGQNGYRIVYTSWDEDDRANITMAKKFTGFTLHDETKNIWKVDIGKGTYSRQAYFNDVPGIRARTVGYLKNPVYYFQSHYECDNKEMLDIEYPQEVEFVYHIYWFNVYHVINKISETDEGRIRIDMDPEYFYTGYNRVDYYDQTLSKRRQTPSYMENSYQFLDQQGEFYVDKHKGYLYYIPRPDENMSTLEVKLPLGEEMIKVKGRNFNNPVCHVAFEDLILEGATWLRTEQTGGADFVQNNFLNDIFQNVAEETDRWCIYFEAVRYIDVRDCLIRHIGCPGGALMFYRGAKHINIIGNEIAQTSGVGLCVDYMRDSHPQDRPLNNRCEYVRIENNYIHNIAMDYEGGAALTVGHLRHSNVSYNEISNVPYSGIHVGWGWERYNTTGSITYDFEISYNYIHDMMNSRLNDGGAIYTLGKSSLECEQTPTSSDNGAHKNRIIGNYFANGWNCDYMYHDNSSSSWYVVNNVGDDGPLQETEFNFDRTPQTVEQRYWSHLWHEAIAWVDHHDNYATKDHAYHMGLMNNSENNSIEQVHIVTDGNWPEEARKIMREAGIQDQYKDRYKLTGPRVFASIDRWQSLELGVPQDSGIKILGDYNTEYPVSDFDIQWWIDDPEAVTIDKNGMLTAHKAGIYEAEAFLFLDGVWQSTHFMLECGNEPVKGYLNHEFFNIVEGESVAAKAYVDYALGDSVEVTGKEDAEVTFVSDDPSVASIKLRDDGTLYEVTAHKMGSTNVKAKIVYEGKTFEFDVPVQVIKRSNEEALKLPFKEFDFANGAWQSPGALQNDGGFKLSGSPNNYLSEQLEGLYAFDVVITPGHGWPAFTFGGDVKNGVYTASSCYMIGFTKEYIEFQRFNKGVRTMIYGNSHNPISSSAISNKDNVLYTYGERMSVVIGAIETDEGTRIVLNLNGVNRIDYLDKTSGRLPAKGWWAIYNPSTNGGNMTF